MKLNIELATTVIDKITKYLENNFKINADSNQKKIYVPVVIDDEESYPQEQKLTDFGQLTFIQSAKVSVTFTFMPLHSNIKCQLQFIWTDGLKHKDRSTFITFSKEGDYKSHYNI